MEKNKRAAAQKHPLVFGLTENGFEIMTDGATTWVNADRVEGTPNGLCVGRFGPGGDEVMAPKGDTGDWEVRSQGRGFEYSSDGFIAWASRMVSAHPRLNETSLCNHAPIACVPKGSFSEVYQKGRVTDNLAQQEAEEGGDEPRPAA